MSEVNLSVFFFILSPTVIEKRRRETLLNAIIILKGMNIVNIKTVGRT